jgi:hypothetical protein
MIKCGILTSPSTHNYIFNPNLFAKGKWSDISRLRDNFKLTIDYNNKGERALKGRDMEKSE